MLVRYDDIIAHFSRVIPVSYRQIELELSGLCRITLKPQSAAYVAFVVCSYITLPDVHSIRKRTVNAERVVWKAVCAENVW